MYKLKIKTISLIFLITAIFSIDVVAGSQICEFQKGILSNANYLYNKKQFLLSATQYSLLFNSKCEGMLQKARYNYSLAMIHLGENDEILDQYRFFKESDPQEKSKFKSLLEFSTNDLSNKRVAIWNSLPSRDSVMEISKIDASHVGIIEQYLKESSTKSPFLAGGLSALIPGAGQIYNGAYQSAAISFILNSIFLFSTVKFAKQDLTAPAIASGLVFSVTYIGNIMNAARGSNNINSKESKLSKEKIKRILFPILELRY